MRGEDLDTTKLDGVTLKMGWHATREKGMCAMEAAAYFAGEEHTDSPKCVCPVIAAAVRHWNDSIVSDERRTGLLMPLIPEVIGTRTNGDDERRRLWLVADWFIRECATEWLSLHACTWDNARVLREASEIKCVDSLKHAVPLLEHCRYSLGGMLDEDSWLVCSRSTNMVSEAMSRSGAMSALEAASAPISPLWKHDFPLAIYPLAVAKEASVRAIKAVALDALREIRADASGFLPFGRAYETLRPTVCMLQRSFVGLVRRMASVGV